LIALISFGISANANVKMSIEKSGNSRPYLVIENTYKECKTIKYQLYDHVAKKWLKVETISLEAGEKKKFQPLCNWNNFRLNKTTSCW
jgi:hypothetical protein